MSLNKAAIVVIIAAVLYLCPLFLDAPLTDPDEGLHGAIAQEMNDRGDLIVPRFLGRAFLDKPILFFWAQAASIAVLGGSTAAARLPGMLFALLGIATTGWLAGTIFSEQRVAGSGQGSDEGSDQGVDSRLDSGQRFTADRTLPSVSWIAATCYATMALPFVLAQAPVHDMALVPLTNLALGFLWRARERPNAQSSMLNAQAALAGVALGLSILTKGLEGVAIVGVGYGLYLIFARLVTWRLVWQGVVVLAIAAAIALPWYLAMEAREPGYLRYYFVDRHLLGFATETQRHGGQPWWFYLPLVFAGGLPWFAYLRWRSHPLPWAMLAGGVALLSLSGSKSVTYLLPVMPAVAILAAETWSNPGSGDPDFRLGHAFFFFVIAALTPWEASRYANRPMTTGEVGSFVVLAGVWLWMMIRVRKWPAATAWWRLVIATTATYALAFALLGPTLAQAHSARDLADYLNESPHLPATIYVMDGRVSFVYYLRAELRRELRRDQIQNVSAEQLAALPSFPPDAVVALPTDLADRLARVPQLAHASYQTTGRYVVVSPAGLPSQ